MDVRMEQQVRERAYQIWIEAGMAEGFEQEHWIAAERDIVAKLGVQPMVSKRATASKAKPVAAKPKTGNVKAAKAKTSKSAKLAPNEAHASLN